MYFPYHPSSVGWAFADVQATAEQRTATPAVPAPTVARPVAKSKGKRKLNDGEVTHDAHSDARKRAKTGVKSGKRTIKPAPTTTTANTASNNAAISKYHLP